jgi:hypothetical protein
MNVSEEVDLEDYVSRPDKISAADITAICQEAGMLAVRKNRYIILPKDFERAYKVCWFSLRCSRCRLKLNKEPTILPFTNKGYKLSKSCTSRKLIKRRLEFCVASILGRVKQWAYVYRTN